jgi:aspartate aminotransferase-like enzyme
MKSNFRLPGPTPLPPAVFEAMQREMIPHRGDEFKRFYRTLLERLRAIHKTSSDVLTWPASGSAGWEIGLTNLLSPSDAVLAVSTGDFGDRFARVAEQLGLTVHRVYVEWGRSATVEHVAEGLQRYPDVKAVLLTHNETSTGVTNPISALAAVARDHGALVLVDAVSSLAGLPLLMDDWEIDFVLSGSQKAWMCPPGLAIVGIGPRAWNAYARSTFPRCFWDIDASRTAAERGMTPATPSLPLLYALDAAVEMIETESLESVWKRHADLRHQTRAGLQRLGLRLLANQDDASNTVTAFFPPDGIAVKDIVGRMKQDHGVTLTGGQGHMAGTIVRIGHMGWVDSEDIANCLSALDQTLAALGSRSQEKS